MALSKIQLGFAAAFAALSIYAVTPAQAQTSSGKVTSSAPTYLNNSIGALSLDTAGNLRVVDGGSGPTGTQDVNIVEVGGNAVTTTVPISGSVSITGQPVDVDVLTLPGVDLTEIAGNAVASTVTGALDVTCVSGCVAGSGVSQGTATAAPPTYVGGTNNALSLDLAGNLRTSMLTPLVAGTANIGDVDIASALPAGNNNIGDVDAIQSGTWNIGTVTAVTAISNALPAGNNNIGDVDVASLPALPAGNNNIGDVDVASLPALADQGTSNFSLIAANSTNATSIKGSAGAVYELTFYNNSATIAYAKFYNTSGTPTCGSGTPVARYLIPGAASGGAGSNVNIALGKTFSSGIGMCVTTGIADADTGAVAASAYIINVTYK